MAISNAVRYKGFFLDCEPIKNDVACFVARVTISHESGQALDEYVFRDLCIAVSAPLAVSFAKAWGRQWVDQHIQEADVCASLGVHSV